MNVFALSNLRWASPLRGARRYVLLFLTNQLFAQNAPIKFERFSLEQGLSQSTVYCVLQDRQGFLWFGTGAGLNRYDGYGFITYKHDATDSTSISGDWIKSFYEDRTGALWIGTFNYGLNRFDPATERFTRFMHAAKDPHSLSDNDVNTIYEDRAGTLWVGTNHGLNRLNRGARAHRGETFTRFLSTPQKAQSLKHPTVTTILEDRYNRLWVGTEGGGLHLFDRNTEQFTHFVHDPRDPRSLADNFVQVVYEDRAGRLWIGTQHGGLHRLDQAAATGAVQGFTRFPYETKNTQGLSHPEVRAIGEDRWGKLWIGTLGGGLNYFDPERPVGAVGQFTHFVNAPENTQSLSNNRVFAICADRSGAFWIGTDIGFNLLDRGKERFIAIVNESESLRNSNRNFVWSICKSAVTPNTLWIGTESGLFRRTWNEHASHHWATNPTHGAADEQVFYLNQDLQSPLGTRENRINAIYEDAQGTIWLGTAGGLKFLMPKTTSPEPGGAYELRKWEEDPMQPSGLEDAQIFAICEDATRQHQAAAAQMRTFWIGTSGGLVHLQYEPHGKKRITVFKRDREDSNSLSSNNVRSLLVDRTGTLWVGTWADGLHQFDPQTKRFQRFAHEETDPQSIANNFIRIIFEDRAGRLWIGTDGGLNQYDRVTKKFQHYTEKDGLPNNKIWGILEDERGRLWLSTNNGLSCFDPRITSAIAPAAFRNYTIRDGLSHQEFNRGAWFQSNTGEIFFGSMNGVTAFHPDSIRDNPFVPPVVITACKRYNLDNTEGIAILERGISARREIEFSYKDNIITFEFAALSFRNSAANRYAYKLEGDRAQWIQLGTHREATFTNLAPGAYVLRVRGSNNDGIWNEAGTAINVIITPPWWRTRWAYSGYALLLLCGAVATDRILRRRVITKERERAEAERQELELKKAAELKIAYEQLKETLEHLQATQQQLVTQQKLASLGQLTAGIAHEIKNPLNFVNNFAALSVDLAAELREELAKLETAALQPVDRERLANLKEILETLEQNAERINHHGRRADSIVKSMMQHARGSSGQREMANLNHLLDEAVNLAYHGLRANEASFNITLEKEYDESIGKLAVVPQDLSRVFLNMVNNACYAAHQKKKTALDNFSPMLSVSTKNLGAQVEIRIRDNGNGIPKDIREKIFNPFFTTKPTGQGTGLGLSISHDIIVQQHRGELAVETEEGKFTEFVVRLPKHQLPETLPI